MSHSSVSELLVEAFATDQLMELNQSKQLPELPNLLFCNAVNAQNFDFRGSFISQKQVFSRVFENEYRLTEEQLNYCYFIDLLFEAIDRNSCLANELIPHLIVLKPTLLRELLLNPKFVQSSKHLIRTQLDRLFHLGIVFSEQQQSSPLINEWSDIIKSLTELKGEEDCLLPSMESAFTRLEVSLDEKLNSTQSLIQKRIKKIEQSEPQRKVNDFLDGVLHDHPYPKEIANFFTDIWQPTLLNIAQQFGFTHNRWLKVCEFTQNLSEHYALDSEQSTIALIPEILPKVEKYMGREFNNKIKTLNNLDEINANILNNKIMEGVKIEPFLEKNRLQKLNISSSAYKIATKLKIGQWIEFSHLGNHPIRMQLCHNFEDIEEFYLVDVSGKHKFSILYEKLAYELISKRAKVIETSYLFNKCFIHALEQYLKKHQIKHQQNEDLDKKGEEEKLRSLALEKAKQEAESLRLQKANLENQLKEESSLLQKETAKLQQDNEELEGKLKREIEDKYRQATQAILKKKETISQELEKRYLAEMEELKEQQLHTEKSTEEEKQHLLQEKEKLEQQLNQVSEENKRHQINEQIQDLTVGSWLALDDEEGTPTSCKIAVIYGSSGKYVFVDKLGMKVAEHHIDDLFELMMQDKATVIKRENSFDDSMQRVIQSLRS